MFHRQTYKILLTSLVAASTTCSPQDKYRQQGGLSQNVIGHVKAPFVAEKAPFGLVIDPLLQLCLRLIIEYPKKDINVSLRVQSKKAVN
jgi:hypothetical protein